MDNRRPDRAGGGDRHTGETAVGLLTIFNAWSDEPWINEGAAVRVSLICFGAVGGVEGTPETRHDRPPNAGLRPAPNPAFYLDGQPVAAIHADLSGQPLGDEGTAVDLTIAKPLPKNRNTAFQGPEKNGAFDIPGDNARAWLKSPNPHGKPNSLVVKPRWNGIDLTRRPQDIWIIDFGTNMSEESSALFETPFKHVFQFVKPDRDKNKDNNRRKYWWRFGRTGEDMRAALTGLTRYIATPEVAKHRVFVWMDATILPDKKLIVIARSDDITFGILQSRIHEVWALAVCTWHGVGNDPRYTPTTTFETFPFPAGLTPADTRPPPEAVGWAKRSVPITVFPDGHAPLCPSYTLPATPFLPTLADPSRLPHAEAIAQAAFELNRLRDNWLNPPEWVDWVITPEEAHAGFPRRPVARPGHEADLKQRTLTNLYNARPAWLAMAHQTLDRAVAAAYGWDDYTPELPDGEILRRLLALNRVRSAAVP